MRNILYKKHFVKKDGIICNVLNLSLAKLINPSTEENLFYFYMCLLYSLASFFFDQGGNFNISN